MACRQRASENSFNRRRRLILEKGFELAHYQKDTALGGCILNTNVKEDEILQTKLKEYDKQTAKAHIVHDQKRRFFDHERDMTSLEPSILIERNHIDRINHMENEFNSQPRYMRRLTSKLGEPFELVSLQLFKAVRPRKNNVWDPVLESAGGTAPINNHNFLMEPPQVKFRPIGAIGWPLMDREFDTLRERDRINRSHSAMATHRSRTKSKTRKNDKYNTTGQNQLLQILNEEEDAKSVLSQSVLSEVNKNDSDNIFITQWKPVLNKKHQLVKHWKQHEAEFPLKLLKCQNSCSQEISFQEHKFSSSCRDSQNIDFLKSCVKTRPKSGMITPSLNRTSLSSERS